MLIAVLFTLDCSLYPHKGGQLSAGGVSVPMAWDASWDSEDLGHFTASSRTSKWPMSATAPHL